VINKLYHEDWQETVKRINPHSVDLIIADPPYGMEFRSNHRYERYDPIHNDNNLDWLGEWVWECQRIMKNNTHLYCFCSFHNVDIFKKELSEWLIVKNILIWEKNNTSMGDLEGDYAPKYEMIIFCVKGKRKLNGRRDSNIIYSQRTQNKLHPTQKPTKLIRYLVGKSTEEGDIVYDPFMGSGTTAIACIREKRNWIGSEINIQYVNTANDRINVELNQLTLF